ncbi:MAG: bifunctional diaminohydroxyphosphoribosylaminopyrimidine deaminase/5-amino-6-(5-phosphoribosylamino)uracil reductase RibD [Bacteroidota bacterium]
MINDQAVSVHELYMRRCLQLAALANGYVAPNPMVGAVLVHNNRIIGEGYHQKYGGAHAEVNAINQAIQNGQEDRIPQSVLYVSLEPCAHHGKTPPCADLIIAHKIPGVVIGCRDPFKEVNGKGIEKLAAAGIRVELGILEKECKELNKRFFTFHLKHRPYVILKWAQTADAKMTSLYPSRGGGSPRLFISNEYSNCLVHKWRSEEAGILIGTNTAASDDPELTTRLWDGPSPIRLVIDMDLRLPSSLKIFNQQVRTIVFNKIKHEGSGNLLYYQVTEDVNIVHQVVNALHHLRIQSVIVEGGAMLLQSFIDEQLWDEARIITNTKMVAGNGLPAPKIIHAIESASWSLHDDRVAIFTQSIL